MQGAPNPRKITHNTEHRMQMGWFLTSTPHGHVLIDKTDQGKSSQWFVHPDGSIQNHEGKYLSLTTQPRDHVSIYAGLSPNKTFFDFSQSMIKTKDGNYFLIAHRFFPSDKVGNQTTRVSFHTSEHEGHLWKIE